MIEKKDENIIDLPRTLENICSAIAKLEERIARHENEAQELVRKIQELIERVRALETPSLSFMATPDSQGISFSSG